MKKARTMLMRPRVERIAMSKEEFLRRADRLEEGLRDWEEGVAIRGMVAHSRHGYFIAELYGFLKTRRGNGVGKVRQEVFVDFGSRTFGADLAVLFPDHVDRLQKGRIQGCPDIVVEVLSEDSVDRDRTDKFDAYWRAGVPWYWIGDPEFGILEEYQHTAQGYVRTASGNLERPFQPLALPGLQVPLDALLED
ncbi:MAG: Uma2 family endonuclease [Candidatus Xenobia bacterium]